ncbi:MAG: hypothetical protein A3I26_02010 [Candidatus Yanofskybacteria bacterium RIFCSPLOWO2_02_FULL_43_10]|uniref:Uncharacterized protein n=1 Tax=Candidatus Yanofskybacteria bacterium RIFCSPLOWO2_12_FULL_43_11b TaxID=1802710 RepID=A0A1F8H8L3_9BACT|nr:MAG: hypothetical protein A2742_02775 [Candidatus Yanofskybacteria bacterium RIFCSPHIGHO2_01_FULL_43_32]OGN12060.1 MAG: hypothetical protein A3C69_00540 [Candidatus Yanofskybacteria bacterium RIFCSPHIGHO2_02_FULL_43_12]OGN17565.1 MAG: hypothetical protein A3E34_03330 [Candidatus Yanofskybacteria bacterium RIFCSPHIGHO2_12_FULL_43_11]OGN25080.1 MAG: hypothetical protein A2923_01730 [Candidatus Yanofskybacteria bacterium RIFCSPLOWO2_01_FULL_43_46]OGN28735.1 MAG: hypothetical protein A3I26_02010
MKKIPKKQNKKPEEAQQGVVIDADMAGFIKRIISDSRSLVKDINRAKHALGSTPVFSVDKQRRYIL